MVKIVLMLAATLALSTAALADAAHDCFKDNGDIAIRGCSTLLKSDPRNVRALSMRGWQQNNIKKDFESGLKDYTRATEIDPKDADAHHGRAFSLEYLGRMDEAMRAVTRSLHLRPDNALALNDRAIYYRKQDKIDLAMADIEKSIKINPARAAAYKERGFLRWDKDRAGSIADYRKAYVINPDDAEVRDWLIKQGEKL